mmetsp:Transcript_143505/g.261106  ORF Transcript_143505/g.261106 Transcript_143505/m.261106 type:complete len:686 (-) Transcript_143505:174-2231(-)
MSEVDTDKDGQNEAKTMSEVQMDTDVQDDAKTMDEEPPDTEGQDEAKTMSEEQMEKDGKEEAKVDDKSRLTMTLPALDALPLAGLFDALKDKPDPPFLDAMKPIADADLIPDLMEAADKTLGMASYLMEAAEKTREKASVLKSKEVTDELSGDLAEDPLPLNNLCSILQYCDQSTSPSLCSMLTDRCFDKDRTLVKPFTMIIWLLMKTLELLEPYEGRTVFRSSKGNLKDEYPVGKEFTMQGFMSATPHSGVAHPGIRDGEPITIFRIECMQKQARDISKYSSSAGPEILFPPGCRFRVMDVSDFGVTYIHLHEVRSLAWIHDLWPKTSESMQEVIDIFKKIDLDYDQRLSKDELTAIMVEVGMEQGSAEKLIAMADKDKSGDLDFPEFVSWIFDDSDMAQEVKGKFKKPEASGAAKTVSVNTMGGDSVELSVPMGIKASDLRAKVAELLDVPKLETGLLDNSDGTLIFFGDPTPMKVIPDSITLIRTRKWAGVPQGLHHPDLTVSEDRRRVEHKGEYQNAACYLTAALDRGGKYTIDVDIEMDYTYHCLWLGVTSDRMTKWDYLEGCFFSSASGYWKCVWDCFFAPTHSFYHADMSEEGGEFKKTKVHDTAKIDEILAVDPAEGPKKLRVVLDMRAGKMELYSSKDELLVQHCEPEFLVEDALRICICFLEPGATLEITGCQAD